VWCSPRLAELGHVQRPKSRAARDRKEAPKRGEREQAGLGVQRGVRGEEALLSTVKEVVLA